MPLITSLESRIVFNSRGDKTIEVDIITDDRYIGRASAPSGASVGKHEVQSFPHNEPQRAIQVLNSNSNKFIGAEASEPRTIFEIIRTIDSTPSYSIIGGSMAYALSVAAVDSASKALGTPLVNLLRDNKPCTNPYPLGNFLGGGAHAGPGTPDIQEILVCPVGATNIVQALEMNLHVPRELRKMIEIEDKTFTNGKGDEGA